MEPAPLPRMPARALPGEAFDERSLLLFSALQARAAASGASRREAGMRLLLLREMAFGAPRSERLRRAAWALSGRAGPRRSARLPEDAEAFALALP